MCREIICIVCPNSCKVRLQENNSELVFSGNRCKRGETYAISEVTHPMRTLTTTVKTIFPDLPFIPVKTAGTIEKHRRFELMERLSSIVITKKQKMGDVILGNFYGTDIVTCCDMTLEYGEANTLE